MPSKCIIWKKVRNIFHQPANVVPAVKNALQHWHLSYMWIQRSFYHAVVQNTSPQCVPIHLLRHCQNKPLWESQNLPRGCKCWCPAALCRRCCAPARTEPLRRKVLGRWRSDAGCRASGVAPTSSSNWVGARTTVGPGEWQRRVEVKKKKNEDLQIQRWKEIICGISCFPFFGGSCFFKKDCDISQGCNTRFLMPISLLRRSMRTDLNIWQALSHGTYSKCDCNCGATAEHTFNTLHWVYCINWVP